MPDTAFDSFIRTNGAGLAAEHVGSPIPKVVIEQFYPLADLLSLKLPPRDEIVTGLARCELGSVNAVTNSGKTTLLRNLTLSLAVGRRFTPLIEVEKPRRIIYLDAEDTRAVARDDFSLMMLQLTEEERRLAQQNIAIVSEAQLHAEELRLSSSDHFTVFAAQAEAFKPDLIIIDTFSRAFKVTNENDNSEVKEKVMLPLSRLARITNAAVLVAHHIGKSKAEEGGTKEGAHRARGASSFADQSRVMFNLEKDQANERVILSCPKRKGRAIDDYFLTLDPDTRWFSTQQRSDAPIKTSYQLVVGMFEPDQEYTTRQVIDQFTGRIAQSTVKMALKDAVANGDLEKLRHGAYWNPNISKGLEESLESL